MARKRVHLPQTDPPLDPKIHGNVTYVTDSPSKGDDAAMADSDLTAWRMDVSGKLGMLVQQTTDLTAQVTRQNGNVAKLWSEMDSIKRGDQPPSKSGMEMLEHIKERVSAIESARQVEKTTASVRISTISTIWEKGAKQVVAYLIAGTLMYFAAVRAGMVNVPNHPLTETVKTSNK